MADFVFEIGTEEIPARFMKDSLAQLRKLTAQNLLEERIEYKRMEVYGTPRRLVVYIEGLADRQPDLVEENRGPSVKVAYDADGNLSKAALGFARGQGVAPEELYRKETENGEYVFAEKKQAGLPAIQIMSELLPKTALQLHFPKPMRWGSGELRYVRPIRWLCALIDSDVVEFEIENVASGRLSRGHRFFGKSELEVPSAAEYFGLLRENCVIVDQEERRVLIQEGIKEAAAALGGKIEEDKELLEEIVHLVEYPTVLSGSFDENFLRIPQEAIITPMKEHQRYFPVFDASGELLPYFITVRNGGTRHLEIVRRGNEKVLEARLQDARFFYEEDQKKKLVDYVPRLADIVFQDKLGSMLEKVERIRDNVRDLAEALGISEDVLQDALRAAYLSKADLITNMVYEFPELEGIMGEKYALLSGENKEVAQAIQEHYKPRFAGDGAPESLGGALVSLADKLDTIAGCFAAGIEPSGSWDPYALRRLAAGISTIVLDKKFDISIKKLIRFAVLQYKGRLSEDTTEIEEKIYAFFEQRVRTILSERGFRYDIIEAVMAEGYDKVGEVLLRAEALDEIRKTEDFQKMITTFTRANNLAKNTSEKEIKEELLVDESEAELYKALVEAEREVLIAKGKKDFGALLQAIAALEEKISLVFDRVMIMDKNEDLKNNRLALLRRVVALSEDAYDLAKIVQD